MFSSVGAFRVFYVLLLIANVVVHSLAVERGLLAMDKSQRTRRKAPLTVRDCRPVENTRSARCSEKIQFCSFQHNIKMKWTGDSCKGKNTKWRDAGCQCDQYCGYHCRTACTRDSQCNWRDGRCWNRATGKLGRAMTLCPVLQTSPGTNFGETTPPTLSPHLHLGTRTPTIVDSLGCHSRDYRADVVWALDESFSVKETVGLYANVTQFVVDVLNAGGDDAAMAAESRLSFVEFAGESVFLPGRFSDFGEELRLSDVRSRSLSAFTTAIKTLTASGGYSVTHTLFDYLRTTVFPDGRSSNDRTVRRVVLLMTDGLPTDEFGFQGTDYVMIEMDVATQQLLSWPGSTTLILIKTRSDLGADLMFGQPQSIARTFLKLFTRASLDLRKIKDDPKEQAAIFDLIFPCRDVSI